MAKKQLTLKVTKMAFYNGALVLPNEIIRDYKGAKVPSWATLLNGDEVKKDDIPKNSAPEKTEAENDSKEKTPEAETDETNSGDETPKDNKAPEKTEVEIMEEYNALLDEAVEKNILLEDADKKTIEEQIIELKKLLGKE